jgi:hypothetical protein
MSDDVLALALWVLQTDAKGLRDSLTRDLGLRSQPVLFAQWTDTQVAGYWWDGVTPERQRILQADFKACQGRMAKIETPAAAEAAATKTKTTAPPSLAPRNHSRPPPPPPKLPTVNLLALAREIEREKRERREAATKLHRPPPPLM